MFPIESQVFLHKEDPYTHPLDIPIADLQKMNVDSIYISAKIFCLETINTDQFMGVFALKKDTTPIHTFAIDFAEKTYLKEKSWTDIQVALKYNDTLFNRADRLRIFANDVILRDVYLKDYEISFTGKDVK